MNNATPGQHQRPREPESGLEAVHASEYTSYPEVYDHHQQGPEVCPPNPHQAYDDQGLEAWSPNAHNYPYPAASAPHDGSQPQVYSAVGGRDEKAPGSTHVGPLAANSQNRNVPWWRRKRKTLVIVGIVVAVVVIAAAVVGGILGSQATESDGDEGTTSSSQESTAPDPQGAAMTGTPASVAPGLAPTAVSWGYPHLEVFALTKNGTASVYRKWRDSNATSERDFRPVGVDMALVGGSVDTGEAPSVAVNRRVTTDGQSQNRTDLHILADKRIRRKYHSQDQNWGPGEGAGSWNRFRSPADIIGAPTLVSYALDSKLMKSFFLGVGGPNSCIYYYEWTKSNNDWGKYNALDGPDLYPWATPAVLAWAGDDTRLDVFSVSRLNNHLIHWHKTAETDQWSEAEDLKGFLTTPPTAVSRAPGRIDVFARGGDGGLWHLALGGGSSSGRDSNNGTWSGWRRLGGDTAIDGQPHAVSSGADSVDVFAWGAVDGALLHATYNATAGAWRSEGEGETAGFATLVDRGLVGPPSAAVDGTGDVYVFAYNRRNELVWLTLGPDKKPRGAAAVLAEVPYNVA